MKTKSRKTSALDSISLSLEEYQTQSLCKFLRAYHNENVSNAKTFRPPFSRREWASPQHGNRGQVNNFIKEKNAEETGDTIINQIRSEVCQGRPENE